MRIRRHTRFIAYLEMFVLALLTGGRVLIMDSHPVHCVKIVLISRFCSLLEPESPVDRREGAGKL